MNEHLRSPSASDSFLNEAVNQSPTNGLQWEQSINSKIEVHCIESVMMKMPNKIVRIQTCTRY